MLHTSTGLFCPGCGALRSLHQLLHGHLAAALRFNPLLVLSLPFAAFFFLRCARQWAAGRALPPLALRPGWLKLLVGVVIAFTILRNIHYPPFTYLAPP
jgi:hypothetical protein